MKKIQVTKKVISNLEKCYSIAPLHYQGKEHILVAAEKKDPCHLFDLQGNLEDTIWEQPGGVMSMVQVPGSDGQFLATHKFYSPNDSKEAKIVVVTPKPEGGWTVQTLVQVPHIHRFDILERDGTYFLFVCTLKSGHEYKEDWRAGGKVYAAQLPEELGGFSKEHQLELTVLKDNMLKNHGYSKDVEGGIQTGVVCCEEGVFRFVPPGKEQQDWFIEGILDQPISDAVLVDLDGDGEKELCALAPYHGSQIVIYKRVHGVYQEAYQYEEPAEFVHAVYGGYLCGVPTFVVGHRQGKRNLIAITYDEKSRTYQSQILDEGCGPANVFHYISNGKDKMIATNREINEVAMYTLE